MYNTALGVIFGVKKYANSLLKVVQERDIKLNFHRKCVEITKNEAIFENTQEGTIETFKVSRPLHTLTHAHTPPHTLTHAHTVRLLTCQSSARCTDDDERSTNQ